MHKRISYILLFVVLVSIGMKLRLFNTSGDKITDLIPLIHLQAGMADTLHIEDLFYSEDYALEFAKHPSINIQYEEKRRQLILNAPKGYEGLTLLEARLKDQMLHIPVLTQIIPEHTFALRPGGAAQEVSVFGGFNSWNRHSLPMADEDGDGVYQLTLSLAPGRYEYRFCVDGEERIDTGNPQRVPNPFGEYNSLLEVAPRHAQALHVHPLRQQSVGDSVHLYFAVTQGGSPVSVLPEQVVAMVGNLAIALEQIVANEAEIKLSLPKQNKAIIRCAVARHGAASLFQQLRLEGDENAFHWQDGVIYSIMIDRFADGNPSNSHPINHPELADQANYHGGDLQGIIDKMDEGYFDSLGVNALWLFPVNDNPDQPYQEFPEPHRWYTGYHGYWPVHPEKIEPRFGDMALFQTLVNKAHDRGIKVLLDFVSNHVHQDHPYFKAHPEWFGTLNLPDGRKNIHYWDEYRLTTWFDTFLPSFDYLGSDHALDAMTDNAVWWMKKTGIDGFRQDAVKRVPNRFWRTLTRKIRRDVEIPEQRETYQIGETFGSYDLISSYVNNGQLDAQFNFQIYDLAQYVFLTPDASFAALDAEMQKTFHVYGMQHVMGNLMDSHDKVRYMAQADGDVPLGDPLASEKAWTDRPSVDYASSYEKAKLYLAFILTIPGVPVIYYGDEIGLTGAADPDNRRPMRFDEALKPIEAQMKASVSRLIGLRREHSALRRGDFFTLAANANLYAYLRSDMDERVLVVLNKSEKKQGVVLELPDFYRADEAVSLWDGTTVAIRDQRIRLSVPPLGAGIYRLK